MATCNIILFTYEEVTKWYFVLAGFTSIISVGVWLCLQVRYWRRCSNCLLEKQIGTCKDDSLVRVPPQERSESLISETTISLSTILTPILTPKQSTLPLFQESSRKSYSQTSESHGKVQVMMVSEDDVHVCVIQAILWEPTKYVLLIFKTFQECMDYLASSPIIPDVLILDLDGLYDDAIAFCKHVRDEYNTIELPILLTASPCLEKQLVDALEIGASDYILKPVRRQELIQRVSIQLNMKTQYYYQQDMRVNDAILHNILPRHAVDRIKRGKTYFADEHECVTILFTDICGFTNIASCWKILQVVEMLNDMFSSFDALCLHNDVYKVETIGDSYMCVSGLSRNSNACRNAAQMMRMALDMIEVIESMNDSKKYDKEIAIRVGMHSGPVHSGVVGRIRPRYCLFGDTVNTASRMESNGFKNIVQMTEVTYQLLDEISKCQITALKSRMIKGKGEMSTYVFGQLENVPPDLFLP